MHVKSVQIIVVEVVLSLMIERVLNRRKSKKNTHTHKNYVRNRKTKDQSKRKPFQTVNPLTFRSVSFQPKFFYYWER